MKPSHFITIVLITNAAFIIVYIHNYTRSIQESFIKQKQEKRRHLLITKKEELIRQSYIQQDPSIIKEYALKELSFDSIRLDQIKKMPS